MGWEWLGRCWIQCARGAASEHRSPSRSTHSVNFGARDWEVVPMTAGNPSREAILARIREGLRTPAPPLQESAAGGPIFEAVQNPLERFQQECKSNLMECHLTGDPEASARTLGQVLQSLPEGEIYVQNDRGLRRLI